MLFAAGSIAFALMNQSAKQEKNFMMQSTHASINKLLSIISNSVIRIEIDLIFSIIRIAASERSKGMAKESSIQWHGKNESSYFLSLLSLILKTLE